MAQRPEHIKEEDPDWEPPEAENSFVKLEDCGLDYPAFKEEIYVSSELEDAEGTSRYTKDNVTSENAYSLRSAKKRQVSPPQNSARLKPDSVEPGGKMTQELSYKRQERETSSVRRPSNVSSSVTATPHEAAERQERQLLHPPKKRIKSAVWEYFGYPENPDGAILEDGIPMCKICRRKVCARGGNTSNFRAHLRVHHAAEYSQIKVVKPKICCKSKVWDYFTKGNSFGPVTCNVCKARVSQGSYKSTKKNTTNLWKHLQRRHIEEYREARGKTTLKKTEYFLSPSPLALPTLKRLDDQIGKWPPDHPQAKEMDRLILEMIATDVLPFPVVQGVGFKRLMAKVEPRYALRSEKYFRSELVFDVHEKIVEKIKSLVAAENAGDRLTFTADCWSGPTGALMSLTAHFIDHKWRRFNVTLNVKATTQLHLGEYVKQTLMDILEEWDIEAKRVLLVLRDSGAAIVSGAKVFEMPELSCSAHLLQRIISEGLHSHKVVKDILTKVKQCATHFQHSVVAQRRLSAIQEEVGVPQNDIIQIVPSRWNSTLHMFQRMLEQKSALMVYSSQHGFFMCPSAEEWDILSHLVDTLTVIEEITSEMSRSDSSASCIIPSVTVLKCVLKVHEPRNMTIQTLWKSMLHSVEKRFFQMVNSKEVVLACVLDPRFKERPLSSETVSKAKIWLRENTSEGVLADDIPLIDLTEEEEEDFQRRTPREESSRLLDSLYKHMLTSPTHEEVPEGIAEELERYLREPVIDRKTGNSLDWWSQNCSRFEQLSWQARQYLAIPPSSVPVARAVDTLGDKTECPSGENAEELCFLHYNLPLLDWQY
ncbi:zinc finger BED domain-containing protein 4 isoform X1 [Erpetoichthys calabaricus]|uniref:zinc finger BED domain-containing protein 4 isoform X1 n=1 Tax=Erpetoichthys calabaricus TaxID=27687 RepID=UPI0022343E80|nr:zinc finger BED domain-containing protein 4 isoform X1 [Erpetoichthys calabaricus]